MTTSHPNLAPRHVEPMPIAEALRHTRSAVRGTVRSDMPGTQRGVALLMVMVTLAVMAALTTEFSYNTRTNIWMAGNITADTQAYYHARSATQVAELVVNAKKNLPMVSQALSMMGKGAAAKLEIWRQACAFVEIFSDGRASIFGVDVLDLTEEEAVGVAEGGSFSCTVTAEDSRINLNAAAGDPAAEIAAAVSAASGGTGGGATGRASIGRRSTGSAVKQQKARNRLGLQLFGLFRPMLESGEFEREEDVYDLMLAIMDWTDADETKTDVDQNGAFVDGSGAEGSDYGHGYDVKNAKMDSVGEVQLVEGMSTEIYCKLRDKFTVFATDKVNINDADLITLEGILCGSITDEIAMRQACYQWQPGGLPPPMAQTLLVLDQCRKAKKQLYSTPFTNFARFQRFFQQFPAISGTGVTLPINWGQARQNLGTSTKMVRIEAKGRYRHTERVITTVIDTSNGAIIHTHVD